MKVLCLLSMDHPIESTLVKRKEERRKTPHPCQVQNVNLEITVLSLGSVPWTNTLGNKCTTSLLLLLKIFFWTAFFCIDFWFVLIWFLSSFDLSSFLTRYGEFFHEGNENVTRTIGVLLDMDRGIIAYTNDGISGKTSSWGKHITDNMGIAHRFVRSGGQAASRNSLNSYEGGGGGGVVAGRKRQTLWPTFIFTKVAHKNEFQVDMPAGTVTAITFLNLLDPFLGCLLN